jgi:hypothetical protein
MGLRDILCVVNVDCMCESPLPLLSWTPQSPICHLKGHRLPLAVEFAQLQAVIIISISIISIISIRSITNIIIPLQMHSSSDAGSGGRFSWTIIGF